ncbi:hypothetical protein FE257_006183 [Aspergillus nanangensis]|uniref:Uncharacterized protein n=1 Tax=Aspergillus nanangensis TaxID=2582783 RepID=A0AAD4CPD7_ASPNN|nr:hypothetical protein FE257_006183 [Aspergillus nanangensis]
MMIAVDFDPPGLLSGTESHLRRLAHQRHLQHRIPTFALRATIIQPAHGSPLDQRRHITFYVWDEYHKRHGPYHAPFSYEEEENLVESIRAGQERARMRSQSDSATAAAAAAAAATSTPAAVSSIGNGISDNPRAENAALNEEKGAANGETFVDASPGDGKEWIVVRSGRGRGHGHRHRHGRLGRFVSAPAVTGGGN